MAHEPHAFENQIFQHFRDNAKKINNCIEFLTQHNYTVIDLEGQIINKSNVGKDIKPVVSERRYNTRIKEE